MFCIWTALVKNKANIVLQDAFLKAIVTNGGPVEQALVYLNTTGLLVPPQVQSIIIRFIIYRKALQPYNALDNLRWLKTVSSTFQDLDFDEPL